MISGEALSLRSLAAPSPRREILAQLAFTELSKAIINAKSHAAMLVALVRCKTTPGYVKA